MAVKERTRTVGVDPMKIKDIKVEATVMNGFITNMELEGGYHH